MERTNRGIESNYIIKEGLKKALQETKSTRKNGSDQHMAVNYSQFPSAALHTNSVRNRHKNKRSSTSTSGFSPGSSKSTGKALFKSTPQSVKNPSYIDLYKAYLQDHHVPEMRYAQPTRSEHFSDRSSVLFGARRPKLEAKDYSLDQPTKLVSTQKPRLHYTPSIRSENVELDTISDVAPIVTKQIDVLVPPSAKNPNGPTPMPATRTKAPGPEPKTLRRTRAIDTLNVASSQDFNPGYERIPSQKPAWLLEQGRSDPSPSDARSPSPGLRKLRGSPNLREQATEELLRGQSPVSKSYMPSTSGQHAHFGLLDDMPPPSPETENLQTQVPAARSIQADKLQSTPQSRETISRNINSPPRSHEPLPKVHVQSPFAAHPKASASALSIQHYGSFSIHDTFTKDNPITAVSEDLLLSTRKLGDQFILSGEKIKPGGLEIVTFQGDHDNELTYLVFFVPIISPETGQTRFLVGCLHDITAFLLEVVQDPVYNAVPDAEVPVFEYHKGIDPAAPKPASLVADVGGGNSSFSTLSDARPPVEDPSWSDDMNEIQSPQDLSSDEDDLPDGISLLDGISVADDESCILDNASSIEIASKGLLTGYVVNADRSKDPGEWSFIPANNLKNAKSKPKMKQSSKSLRPSRSGPRLPRPPPPAPAPNADLDIWETIAEEESVQPEPTPVPSTQTLSDITPALSSLSLSGNPSIVNTTPTSTPPLPPSSSSSIDIALQSLISSLQHLYSHILILSHDPLSTSIYTISHLSPALDSSPESIEHLEGMEKEKIVELRTGMDEGKRFCIRIGWGQGEQRILVCTPVFGWDGVRSWVCVVVEDGDEARGEKK
ncbi:MAG: hypothetical protein Q9227_003917 [Pyrenula ochraceoflavens]